jgi:hypothetical protein
MILLNAKGLIQTQRTHYKARLVIQLARDKLMASGVAHFAAQQSRFLTS